MRIAFVSGNREHLPDPVVPLGVLYMMSAAGSAHEKQLIDLCFEADPYTHLDEQLAAFKPDLVAVSMRNIQNADYTGTSTTLDHYDQILRTIRSRTTAPVVMGGGGFSVIPHELMQRFDLDFGVVGEGETPFAMLVNSLTQGQRDVAGIQNLLTRGEPQTLPGLKRADFMDIRTGVRPDRRWVDTRYYERSGITSIQTKRGCAMQCEYCTYPLIEGRTVRQRTGDAVAEEWQAMVEAHPAISHVFVVDSVFNLPPHHAREVSEALIAHGNRTPWTCYLNPIRFDPSLAEVMVRAGCAGVEIGSDSGTDAGLLRLKKGFTTQQIEATSRVCRDAGIKDCHTFILGTREESLDDVRRSLDFIEALDPYGAILMAFKDDREAVDTELAARLGAFREQVLEIMLERARDRTRWVVPSLGLRFNRRLFDRLRKIGLRGPLWQHATVRASK
jgi:hypothetical protein